MADNDPFMRNKDAAVQARTKAQNRANVLQMKMMGQCHPTGLTPNLLKLFEPRPPLEFKAPPEKKKCPLYTGMAQYVSNFAEPGEPEYSPPVVLGETKVGNMVPPFPLLHAALMHAEATVSFVDIFPI